MILRFRQSRLVCLLLVTIFAITSLAADDKAPSITHQKFETAPTNLLYFEDSDTILVQEKIKGDVWITRDAGVKWEKVSDVEGEAWEVVLHPYDNQIAFVIGVKNKHWVTHDQGLSWIAFETTIDMLPTSMPPPLSFHAGNSKKILMHAQACEGFTCNLDTFYTEDGFKTLHILREGSRACIFAHSTPQFKTNVKDKDDDRVLCIARGKFSNRLEDHRLMISDDWFLTEYEPKLEGDRTVQGILRQAAVKGFLVTAAATKGTDELALYVSDDAETWHRAEFPQSHKIKEEAYTILESTNYSIQVDVMNTRPTNPMGTLFSSNSNGTYFTELIQHTNRNLFGFVDFEKIQDIQGLMMVNVVDNYDDAVRDIKVERKIKSKISFDDGRTFEPLTADKQEVHLHSVTQLSNIGRIFSSSAPGIVMGVGNTGDSLQSYDLGDLFVSDDAGLTWRRAQKEAHKYEIGDQGSVLVAVYDEGPTDEIVYSTNHGKDWKTAKLDTKVRPRILTTTPDSTGLKFVLLATKGGGSDTEFFIYTIDFESLGLRKCGDKDFEKWYARKDAKGNPSCLMGHKQYYRRRKADADCFIDEEFKDPQPQYDVCECTKEDFECDFNYIRTESKEEPIGGCKSAETMTAPPGQCKKPEDKFKASSGFRLIPGNACKGGVDLSKEEVERPCKDTFSSPGSKEVTYKTTTFDASAFQEYYYLERTETSSGGDETVVMRTSENKVYISHDHGKTWKEIFKDVEILAIVPHQYYNDAIYFLTGDRTVHYTINRGETFDEFKAPDDPSADVRSSLGFHPDNTGWLIWTGLRDCGISSDPRKCHAVASFSKDRGDDWATLLRYVNRCEFIKSDAREKRSDQLIYCAQHQKEEPDTPLQLVSSDDFFAKTTQHFEDIVAFATMSEFIIVANKDVKDDTLQVLASIDGETFAEALFPRDFQVEHQRAYTVLDSSTHAVFLNVLVGMREDFEYGSIIKSNSNGTSYVMSINEVNRNKNGYVDFEKMLGLEGVAIVNQVQNVKDEGKTNTKKLKSLMTHNDGAQWAPIQAPSKDSEGKSYDCSINKVSECSLNLHGYTERRDSRDTFSSPTAVGLMMGVGNVGAVLGPKAKANTFLTKDGGITWAEVMKGNYMWEYGDQGSIIVIVEEDVATDHVFYTLDEGATWERHEFAKESLNVLAITTMPSDNSRNFLLWARSSESQGKIMSINLDFTGLRDRQCTLDAEQPNGDYTLWSPKHPEEEAQCLFGHITQYKRKRPEAECYNGRRFDRLYSILENCTCSRRDFECDYNYQRTGDGSCALVQGLKPQDHAQVCKDDPNRVSYYEPTGYRRIPLTTCQGGGELDYTSSEHPCPGHEEKYEEDHRGLSGFAFFLVVIVLPFAAAGGIGYLIWRNWEDKFGFGQIRLGESGGRGVFDAEQPWIHWPVIAVSGVVAVLAALPMLIGSAWRGISSLFGGNKRFTTRQSFARGRQDYAVVDLDEDELLGDEDDDIEP